MKATLGTFAVVTALCVGNAHAQSGAFAGQVPVSASLKQAVSSKNAKAGQDFTAALQKPVTVGGTAFPKGSLLLGHVVEVTRHSKTTPNGSLTIVFDHLKPKSGDPVEIKSSVYLIALSENQRLAQRRDADMGMRGTAGEQNATSAVREGTDQENRLGPGMESAAGAPVHVVSAVPGVALAAVASDEKSAIMTAQNGDVELGVSMDMVVGVSLKQ